jgi:hypothetical protein
MLQKNTTTIKVATMKEKNKIKYIYIYKEEKRGEKGAMDLVFHNSN